MIDGDFWLLRGIIRRGKSVSKENFGVQGSSWASSAGRASTKEIDGQAIPTDNEDRKRPTISRPPGHQPLALVSPGERR